MTFSYMQEMNIRDINGNCRCPYCGKYRKRSDFPDQPGHIDFGDNKVRGHIHVDPACRFCLETEKAKTRTAK